MSTVTIATNPEVLAEYGLEAKNAEERKEFINLCLDYVQHLCGRTVDRNFILLPRSTNFKGDLEKAQKFFTDSLKKAMKKDKTSAVEQTAPMPDIDLPDSMLSKLANISSPSDSGNQSQGSSHERSDDGPIILPETLKSEKQAPKKNLIQELQSQEVRLVEPEYSLERSLSEEHLVLRIELPGVTSVSDCQLDISEVCMYARIFTFSVESTWRTKLPILFTCIQSTLHSLCHPHGFTITWWRCCS